MPPADAPVALITGASAGIGRATAVHLAERGLRVGLLARSVDRLRQLQEEIESAGGSGFVAPADIRKPPTVQAAIDRTVEHFGRLDGVFANAGTNGTWSPIDELRLAEWDKTLETNLRGSFATLKFAIPHLRDRGGSIVINSSINGTRVFSTPGATAYSCSKAGLVALAKMAALELAKHAIRVNVICPGAIHSEIEQHMYQRDPDEAGEPMEYPEGQIPLTRGKPGTAEQVARLVAFLVADDSSHITGTEIWIDGGQSLLRG